MKGKQPSKATIALAPFVFLACLQAAPFRGLPDGVTARQIGPKAWLIESKVEIPGFGLVPCNNLLLAAGSARSVLLDALITDVRTEAVLDWAAGELHLPVGELIVTHAQDDRIGGIAAAHRRRIVSYSLPLTHSPAVKEPSAGVSFCGTCHPPRRARELRIEFLFPGRGHAPDNLVMWIPSEKLSYGGCLVKEAAARSIGNFDDADLVLPEISNCSPTPCRLYVLKAAPDRGPYEFCAVMSVRHIPRFNVARPRRR